VFKNLRINDETTELDIFLALMPLSPEKLLEIVRDGVARSGEKHKWDITHIFSALCVLFGAGKFKEGTDLWSVRRKGMMPAPDFGLYLSRFRFEKSYAIGLKGLTGLRNNCGRILGLKWIIGYRLLIKIGKRSWWWALI
jgi:hypothetical protein